MKPILKKLRQKRGDITTSLVSLLILMAAFAMILTALPIFSKLATLDAYLDDVVRYIELTGTTDGIEDTTASLNGEYFPGNDLPELDLVSGLSFIPGTRNIQLGTQFSVTARYVYRFELSDFFSFPITLTARSVGRSEVFFK